MVQRLISPLAITGGGADVAFFFPCSPSVFQMTKAFPDVSWVYLFRDPVEVMVSNLKVREMMEN